jgi:hypothetical protein
MGALALISLGWKWQPVPVVQFQTVLLCIQAVYHPPMSNTKGFQQISIQGGTTIMIESSKEGPTLKVTLFYFYNYKPSFRHRFSRLSNKIDILLSLLTNSSLHLTMLTINLTIDFENICLYFSCSTSAPLSL